MQDSLTKRSCQQCGYEWWPRQEEPPDRCPMCKSIEWDKPLKLSKKDIGIVRRTLTAPEAIARALPPESRDVLAELMETFPDLKADIEQTLRGEAKSKKNRAA